jgi:predicted nuclease with TOPRIM domain
VTCFQLNDAKRKSDEDQMAYEDLQSSKKKVEKDAETLNDRMGELSNDNMKLLRSKKKIQEEVCVIPL